MKRSKYLDDKLDLMSKHGGLLVYAGIVTVTCLVSVFVSLYAVTHQKVVVLPPGELKSRIEVTGDSVNQGALLEFSRAMFDLMCDYSPKNAKRQFETALLYVDPGSYERYRKEFDVMAQNIEVSAAVSSFVIDELEYDPRSSMVKATGKRLMIVNDQVVDAAVETQALEYRVKAGRIYWKELGKWSDVQDKGKH